MTSDGTLTTVLLVAVCLAQTFSDDGLGALSPFLPAGAETLDSLMSPELVRLAGVLAVAVNAVLAGGTEIDVTRVVVLLRVDSLDGQVAFFCGVSTSTIGIVFHALHGCSTLAPKLGRAETRCHFFGTQR